jgi:hypothetical protein
MAGGFFWSFEVPAIPRMEALKKAIAILET